MERGRTAEGNALPLSGSLQASDAVDRSVARAAQDRAADLLPSDADQDGAALCARRNHEAGARLGRRRVRRLHAKLDRDGTNGSRGLREPSESRHRIRMPAKPPKGPALQLEV